MILKTKTTCPERALPWCGNDRLGLRTTVFGRRSRVRSVMADISVGSHSRGSPDDALFGRIHGTVDRTPPDVRELAAVPQRADYPNVVGTVVVVQQQLFDLIGVVGRLVAPHLFRVENKHSSLWFCRATKVCSKIVVWKQRGVNKLLFFFNNFVTSLIHTRPRYR